MVREGGNMEQTKINAYFTAMQVEKYLMVAVDCNSLKTLQYLNPVHVTNFQSGNYVMEFKYSDELVSLLRLQGVYGKLAYDER